LQSQPFPQLHSLLSFIGQFLPVLPQLGLSAAKAVAQIIAVRIEIRSLEYFRITPFSARAIANASKK
jgi:hypothetical protein